MDDRNAKERPALPRCLDMAADLGFRHVWIMFEIKRRDRFAVFVGAADPGKCDHRANIGTAAR